MKRRYAILPALGLAVLMGMSTIPAHAVVDGATVDDVGRYPSVAYLEGEITYFGFTEVKSVCGATLIDPEWVLTAQHCLDHGDGAISASAGRFKAKQLKVTVGRGARDSDGGETREIAEIVAKPEYDPYSENSSNDLALLRLDKPITTIVPMPLDDDCALPGETVTGAGWGQGEGEDDGSDLSNNIQESTSTVLGKHGNGNWLVTEPQQGRLMYGDSGAGLISQRADGSAALVGVFHAFAKSDMRTGEGPALWERTDSASPHYGFIREHVSGTANPCDWVATPRF